MNFENDAMNSLIAEIKIQQDKALSDMLGVGLEKGFITVRQSNPVLIRSAKTGEITFHHSLVIDYLGAERIEALEQENAYLKKLNGDLHKALTEFYEKARPNQWLKNQQ